MAGVLLPRGLRRDGTWKHLTAILCFLGTSFHLLQASEIRLQFNDEGTFNILQAQKNDVQIPALAYSHPFSTTFPQLSKQDTQLLYSKSMESDEARSREMILDKDVAVPTNDGVVLRADVFRLAKDGKYPVILAQTVYGKDVPLKKFDPDAYAGILQVAPDLCKESTCKYLRWEIADPEHWVPLGYIVIHLDARGTGKSPGYFNPWSTRETQDYYDAIEWAAQQPWSSGKVGLLGTSFMAITQWQVAAIRPPHLTAIIPWQGSSDTYRDIFRHGGIASNFFVGKIWYPNILINQHGNGASPNRDPFTNESTTGEAKSLEYLAGSRIKPLLETILEHPLNDEWYRERTPNLARIQVPILAGANWVGVGLHERGSFEGFQQASSRKKWLVAHSSIVDTYSLYMPKYVTMQERFFDHFLKGEDNNWEKQPAVIYEARNPDGSEVDGAATEWPLPQTQWTKLWLDASTKSLASKPPSTVGKQTFKAIGDGVTLNGAPLASPLELVGPLAARLWVSSSTDDMDLFVTLRAFASDGREVTFMRGDEPRVPIAQGWLRGSMRKLDVTRSLSHTPWYDFTTVEKLTPGQLYPVDIEIWPTSVRLPAGYRLALTIQGEDFHRGGKREPGNGSGNLLHNSAIDRPSATFDGLSTMVTSSMHPSYVLLPVIPSSPSQNWGQMFSSRFLRGSHVT